MQFSTSTPKLNAWMLAEQDVEMAEREFRESGFDIAPTDREKITDQLAALKEARARARQAWRDAAFEDGDDAPQKAVIVASRILLGSKRNA